MPDLSLHEYIERIAQQIQDGSVDEAIAHCRQVLSHYPKYVPAYRQLGRACIEKGDYAHAVHFFQCVLSADPEDADAWMNLAVLSDDLGELEQAIWLLERAFEIAPGNAEIRAMLRDMYNRRDGVERIRIELTRGALARLYAAGGFYRLAIEELEGLLRESNGASPLYIACLEVTLARALWNADGMVPLADRVCRSLLEKLPNCLVANLIMGQIRLEAGVKEAAAPYLRIARALDPEGRVAYELFGDRTPVPLQDIRIPYLEYRAEAPAPVTEDMEWLEQVGEKQESLAPVQERESEMPEWLRDWDQESTLVLEETPPTETMIVETDRLRELEPEAPVEAAPEAEVAAPAAEEELPDWLRELEPEAPVEAAPPEAEIAAPAEMVSEEELPDWLRELQAEAPAEAGPEAEVVAPAAEEAVELPPPVEGMPEWLVELEGEAVEAPAPAEAASSEEAAAPKAVAEEKAEEGEVPEWLAELEAQAAGEQYETPLEAVHEPETSPEWLAELETTEAAELTVEEMPEWLEQLHGAEEAAGTVEEQAAVLEEHAPAAEEVAEAPTIPADLRARLTLARAYLEAGDLDAAAREYEMLARSPEVADTLVADLQMATEAHPEHHALHRVLGDAYMRAGRLQEALQAYREALARL